MSHAKRILSTNLESGPFGQVAAFSFAGLAMSLAMTLSYGLQLPAQWF